MAAFFSSSRTFFLLGETTYFGLKPFLGSTPSCDFGRSRTWPIDALTIYVEFRYFWIVFTFVGDSTTTSDRFATYALPARDSTETHRCPASCRAQPPSSRVMSSAAARAGPSP